MLVRYHLLITHPAIDIEAEYTLLMLLEGLLELNPIGRGPQTTLITLDYRTLINKEIESISNNFDVLC